MIHVQGLTKIFRGRAAVDGLTFDVARGELVGLLGPNGAGKSTAMRMLAGFVTPSEGRAEIAGHDVVTASLEARRHLGYMPEDVPLYPDMRVEEYLRYRARLKGGHRTGLKERIDSVMERCGVADVRRRIIGALSKGYRQRIGLADALVHDPDILILDEPTNGLDPNQIRSVRGIIRSLADRHTVLLSTHILAEVEATCQRVIILDSGRIRAEGPLEGLAGRLGRGFRISAELRGPPETVARSVGGLPGVRKVGTEPRPDGWIRLEIELSGSGDPREEVFRLAAREQWGLRHLTRETVSLEEVFSGLTSGEAGSGGDGEEVA